MPVSTETPATVHLPAGLSDSEAGMTPNPVLPISLRQRRPAMAAGPSPALSEIDCA